ncbi:uncharacterized protein LOC123556646 isoform X2 [Mercenaria mercenaria]|uniref:uncharacterized protein LOC123556646 isoform X2 n=1 Tax=Mercenaria mercenaria TaxID=6596 RepID=UPI00234F8E6E|nr:uncharacterized protein LOC123556646 isoform X2 [Mercenaria mercenaria]
MSSKILLDLYRRDPSGNRVVVVQNLQENVRKDNLQNYLEVICSKEQTDIHFPVGGAGVAIAVFEKDVEEKDMSAALQKDIIHERTTSPGNVSLGQRQEKPLMHENEESAAITCGRAVENMPPSPNSANTEQTNYDYNRKHERIKPESAGHETSNNDLKLKIISDDPADQTVETHIERHDRAASLNPQEYDTRRSTAWHDQDKDRNYGVSNVQTPKVAALKPVIRNVQRQMSTDSIEYLKQHVQKKTVEVVLEQAKAMCFRSCFEEKLRRYIVKRHGQLNVEVQSWDPLKIRVCVEGEESLIEEMANIVNQIWHEKIEFNRISDKAIDKWLIMKGLDSSLGKDFLKNFEKQHNCFIQLSEEGEFKVLKPKVQTDDTEGDNLHRQATRSVPDSEFEILHSDYEQDSAQTEAPLSGRRKYEKEQEEGILYQGDMKGYGERQKTKQKRTPRSRFPEKKPVPNLTVVVIAKRKDLCVTARNQLGKRIQEEFLHEDSIDKRQKISEEAKCKIASIIDQHSIESIKEKDKYILKGYKESVVRARMKILEVLLEEKVNTDKRRKRRENAKRGTREFIQHMVEEIHTIPPYWSKYKPDGTLESILTKEVKQAFKQQKYEKVQLDSNGDTFKTIVKMVTSTFDSSKIGQGQDAVGLDQLDYSQLYVVNIQRIENIELYEKFTSARQKVFFQLLKSGDERFPKVEELPDCNGQIQTSQFLNASLDKDLHTEINEVLLFHGTKDENIGTICTSGLDQRLGSRKAMFGPGIYGAECSTKADQYADEKTARRAGQGIPRNMFLIRMVLGNSYLCNDLNPPKYRRPPCTSCYKDDCKDTKHARHKYGHMFDSVVADNGKLFREFVVYDNALCYPEYLITYERR